MSQNVLHVASEYPPAKVYGLGRFVHGLARAQAAQGDTVHVLTNSSGGDEDDVKIDGVHVHRIEFPNPPRPADGHGEVLQFNHGLVARFLDRRDAFKDVQVVASHDWLTALAAREIARELGVPLVPTFHDEVVGKTFGRLDPQARFIRDLEALTAHDGSLVIANSAFIAAQVTGHYGVPADRVIAIPGGIDPALLALRPEAERHVADFRATLASPDEVLVVYVGRLDAEKGLDELATAILEVSPRHANVRFAIAGTGAHEASLRARLSSSARFLGYVKGDALALLYRAADVVVIPSLYEPFGLVALEAMHAGAAVVASSAGGLADIVLDGCDGLVVPPGDSEALSKAIERLVASPDDRERLGAAARARAAEFNWQAVASLTREVYECAIAVPRTLAATAPTLPARPHVRVVLAAGQGGVALDEALRALRTRTDYPNLEVVVVNHEPGTSLGAALNRGAAEADSELLCFATDDFDVGGTQSLWLDSVVWLLETMNAASAAPAPCGRDGRYLLEGSAPRAPRQQPHNALAGLVVRKRDWVRVGGFNETPNVPASDLAREWCDRARAALGRPHWVHSATVHQNGEQLSASVVVVAYDGLTFTSEAVTSVVENTAPPFELILVDNGSKDGTRAFFESVRAAQGGSVPVQVLANASNLGYPIAANQGVRAARGRHVVLLNNDARVRAGWLEALLDAAREPDTGIVTAKILNLDGTVQSAGGILHNADGTFTIPHAGEDRLAPPVTVRREVPSAGGPCMLLTRDLIDRVGTFDETFSPGYFEDSDLCLRAREAGFRLVYEPGAEVVHHGKATASLVAREGKVDVWQRFQENESAFRSRWSRRLAEDEAERRAAELEAVGRKRILLLYGKNATTTAAYCESALRRAHDVVTAGPGQEVDLGPDGTLPDVLRVAGGEFDLLLAIEGENYLPAGIEDAPCPTAWWAIDNHLHANEPDGWHFEVAARFRHVFVAQKDYVPAFRRRGVDATWLPLACDPEVHRRHAVPKDLDVVFVGNVRPFHVRRRRLLERLKKRFRVHEAQGVYRDEMARLFSRAKVVFNCSLAGDLNMRVFEALATESVLVTDRIGNGLGELLADGEHIVLYDDEDLEFEVERALIDTRLARQLAVRGSQLVRRHHTYERRMQSLVSRVSGHASAVGSNSTREGF